MGRNCAARNAVFFRSFVASKVRKGTLVQNTYYFLFLEVILDVFQEYLVKMTDSLKKNAMHVSRTLFI